MANNRFTGVHSKILINLDHVKLASSDGHAGSPVNIQFSDGSHLILNDTDATMFLAQWRNTENLEKS